MSLNPQALQIWYDESNASIILKHPNAPAVKIPIERCGVVLTSWGKPLASQRGWEFIIRILRNHAQNPNATIGMPTAPVQHAVDQCLKGMN